MTLQPASGTRDLNPQQVKRNDLIASKLSSIYELWGYERITPPHVERLETLMAAGGISNNEILKIVADEAIGLRPEMTASIVRAASTRFDNYDRPLRFWSTGSTFKCNQSIDGAIDIEESLQSGVELIGTKSINAEIELLSLLIESLKTITLNYKYKTTLLIGNTYLMKLILKSFDINYSSHIKKIIENLDFISLAKLPIDDTQKDFLKDIMYTRGEPNLVLSKLRDIFGQNIHIDNLENLFSIVLPLAKEKQIEIQLDPTLETNYKLYSGLTFELISYHSETPTIIATGGRYDELVNKFNPNNKDNFGIGFSFSIDKLRELLSGNIEKKKIKTKVLIAYKNSQDINKALTMQKHWHEEGIVTLISHEPDANKDDEDILLRNNRCNKLEWIE